MDVNQLVGRPVTVRSTELFGTPLSAVIRTVDLESKLLCLAFVPVAQLGANVYPGAVAHPRRQQDGLDVLLRDGVLGCAVTCIPSDHYDPLRPFDLSWWRGGAATIADLVL